ncbi:unnamed protein product [Phyllotreta striolata]|uniref:Chitin-binding type-2 domain-containing protein n=1 Tax=Phyllotreta striolata TaxID=444603 RepID=A0A9N9XPL9_PHYSR|nr:unnamed protein product [Phyllotreta striolata]
MNDKMNFLQYFFVFFVLIAAFVNTIEGAEKYKRDCRKYYECGTSGCYIKTCGPGTEFNPDIGTCDYPKPNRHPTDCLRFFE